MYKFTAILMGASCLVLPAAQAGPEKEYPSFYAGAGVTTLLTDIEGPLETLEVEDNVSFNAFTIRGGFDLDEHFSLEAESSWGISGEGLDESVPVSNTSGSFEGDVNLTYLVGVFGKGAVALTPDDRLKTFARIGYMYGEVQAEGTVSTTILDVPVGASVTLTEQSDGPVFGAGLSYDIAKNVTLRGEGTYIGLENFPTMAYTLTLGVSF